MSLESSARMRAAIGCCALATCLAQPAIARADVVKLRTDCGDNPQITEIRSCLQTLDDEISTANCSPLTAPESERCFETIDDVLAEIHNPTGTRAWPSASNPVVVDIGPGEFSLSSTTHAYCHMVGATHLSNLHFRGAGIGVTTLTGGGFPETSLDGVSYVARIENCSDVEFSDLTIRALPPIAYSGVHFIGDGSTRWRSVRIEAEGFAWYDEAATSPAASVHRWSDSELIVVLNEGGPLINASIYAKGSTHSVSGSDLYVEGTGYGPIYTSGGGHNISVYGSALTAVSSFGFAIAVNTNSFATGCSTARILIEGSRIAAFTNGGAGQGGVGVRSLCGLATVRGTHFDLSAAVGYFPTRIFVAANGTADAPYSLGAGTEPPPSVAGNSASYGGVGWNSLKGLDTFTETDCVATGCGLPTTGSESHLLSYDRGCTVAGPWFDTTVQKCRGL